MNVRRQLSPSPLMRAFFLTALPIHLAVALVAQPARETAPRLEARAGADLKAGLVFSYSYSPESDLERGAKIGEVSVNRFDLELNANKRLSENSTALFGLSAKWTDLEISGAVPLPDQLRSVGLSLGARRTLEEWFGPSWSGTAMLRTEFSSDSSGFSDAEAAYGAVAFVSHRQSPNLSWDFGVLARSEGGQTVLPLVGVRWSFAPKWTAALGFPRTGVTYEYSPRLNLHAGASFEGGTYHVSTARAPGLGNTWIDYTEVRAGIRLEYRIDRQLKLIAGAGAVVDREFDYFDRNFSVEGGSASYLSIGLEARF